MSVPQRQLLPPGVTPQVAAESSKQGFGLYLPLHTDGGMVVVVVVVVGSEVVVVVGSAVVVVVVGSAVVVVVSHGPTVSPCFSWPFHAGRATVMVFPLWQMVIFS